MTTEGRRPTRGVKVNGSLLRRLQAERGLRTDHLAARARVSQDVVIRARAGRRIEIANLSKIVGALLATPAGDPMLAALVADEANKEAAAGTHAAAAEEVGSDGAELQAPD